MAVREIAQDADELALAAVAEQVREAQDAIRAIVQADDGPWQARYLREAACNGHAWSSSVLSLALLRLVELRELEIDDQLMVHTVDAA